MAQRHELPDSLDNFPTPPWAVRALMEVVLPHLGDRFGITKPKTHSCWEPACGQRIMSTVLKEYFATVYESDVHRYCDDTVIHDFLAGGSADRDYLGCGRIDVPGIRKPDWIITNPPFTGIVMDGRKIDRALEFVMTALDLAFCVAMFVRTQWAVEGCARHDALFAPRPPTLFAPFSERVPLVRGRWDPDAATATAYCWLVWELGYEPQPVFWIPPGQRKALTRPDDRARFAAWSVKEGRS